MHTHVNGGRLTRRAFAAATLFGVASLTVWVDRLLCPPVGAAVAGGSYALWRWRHLSRRIARRDRRFERNKIFVHYLDTAEVSLSALAYNAYLAIPIGMAVVAAMLLSAFSGVWWAVLVGAFGLASSGVLLGYIICYKRLHGPLYYQYDCRMWSGAEGILYRTATVVKPLTPDGKVDYHGELWEAVSLGGEAIDVGDCVEVISVERLTLYVDRVPHSGPPAE
jgi:membrane protein implicated in regulation of membrane protease activity